MKQVFGLFFSLALSCSAWSSTKACAGLSQEAATFEADALVKRKQAESIDKQLKSNKRAMDDFNRKCRAASSPGCNPMIYNMIQQQTAVLSGQRQKLSSELIEFKTKREEAMTALKACQSKKGKIL